MRPAPENHPELHLLLAYVAGAADRPLRLLMETHLSSCAACARRVEQVTRARGEPDEALPEAPVSPGSLERLMARVDRLPPRPPEDVPLPPALLAEVPAASHWRWQALLSEGSRVAHLLSDERTGSALYLVHLPPRARFPRHTHAGAEDSLLLAGSARVEGRLLEAGDWLHAPPGSEHVLAADDDDCWSLSRVEASGVRLAGWRGVLQRVRERPRRQ